MTALGFHLDLIVSGSELANAVNKSWQDAISEEGKQSCARLTVAVGPPGTADVCGSSIDEVLHHLSPVVTRTAIEARVGDLLMLHAAALGDPGTGAAAILVAPSGTGKTTAARSLGRHFAYLSDETAGIELSGRVLPYRKPLSILEGSWIKTQVAPSDLGLMGAERDYYVAAVLLLDRSPDHGDRPIVTPLDTIDAIAAIVPESSSLLRTERPLHRVAEVIHMAGGAHQVTYRESTSLEPVLTELLSEGR